ncbi:MAG: HEAT repeat domain-containing protein [Pirellulaceae bacterium]|nr:HEAT repeat domain-containing protein [Pirellulaceae bacterium]
MSRLPIRLSLRSLLLFVTLCAIGVFAKQQYDVHQRIEVARQWVTGNVRLPGSVWQSTVPSSAKDLSPEERREILILGAKHLRESTERVGALRLIVELHPAETRATALRLLAESRDPLIRKHCLQLLGLMRRTEDLDAVRAALADDDGEVRAAALDAIGVIREPSYPIPNERAAFSMEGPPRLRSNPPILLVNLFVFLGSKPQGPVFVPGPQISRNVHQTPPWTRPELEKKMLSGVTTSEREAAARGLVNWPPPNHVLRIAEWGVWLDSDSRLASADQALAGIPEFVHRAGNTAASWGDRISPILIVDKPVIHITVNRPMAVDLGVMINWGRPWLVYPRPDDFKINVASVSRMNVRSVDEFLEQFDRDEIGQLSKLSTGYPWVAPRHPVSGFIFAVGRQKNMIVDAGLRWQSLIVSPQREAWMNPPPCPTNGRMRWWHDLRQVPTSWISSRGEAERFLYYDGPTFAQSPVSVRADDGALSFTAQTMFPREVLQQHRRNDSAGKLDGREAIFVRVADGKILASRIALRGDSMTSEVAELPSVVGVAGAAEMLVGLLVERGMTAAEAGGLRDCWRADFFEKPGDRVLMFVSPADYDALCPLEVRPKPTEIVRIGIVLHETTPVQPAK